MNGEVAKKILENEKLFNQYLEYEKNRPRFSTLSKELQTYIRALNKEYQDFIDGKTNYLELSKQAKYKASNKIARAYLRVELAKTNDEIDKLALKTNGFYFYSTSLHPKEQRIISVHRAINESFANVFSLAEVSADYFSINALLALKDYKSKILSEASHYNLLFENLKDLNKNSDIIDNIIEKVEFNFKQHILNGRIDPDEVYFLNNSMQAGRAKDLLKNISYKDLSLCLSDSVYNDIYKDKKQEQNRNLTFYFDDIFGNPLHNSHGNYITNDGRAYFGDVWKNVDDQWIYMGKVEPENQSADENQNISKNR